MSLAILKFEGITPIKFGVLEAAAIKHLGVKAPSPTSGVIDEHGVTAEYVYDGSNVLSITIESIKHGLFHTPKLSEVEAALTKWVEDTLAETDAQTSTTETPAQVPTQETTTTTTTTGTDPTVK